MLFYGLAALLSGFLPTDGLDGQAGWTLSGRVIDFDSGEPVADVLVRLDGVAAQAVTDQDGRFSLSGLPSRPYLLRIAHLAYGEHAQEVLVAAEDLAIELRVSQEAILLAPLIVEAETTEQRDRVARGSSQWVVTREEIDRAIGTSRHLGDLVRQTVPGLHVRQSNDVTGVDVCLEFRAAAQISMVGRPCQSPLVYLDGIPVSDPNLLYGMLSLHTIEQIEVLPPGQAGARYGTGALYGVILIDTHRPGPLTGDADPVAVPLRAGRNTYDWSAEPEGHSTTRTFLTAFAANVVGIAAGVAVAKQCIRIDHKDEIVTDCSGWGTAGAGVTAVALPALGVSLAGRWAGSTDHSVGRTLPSMLGAALALIPGYAYALSTVGSEAQAVNVVGYTFLAIGVPAIVTITDRLFRRSHE